MAMSVGTLFTAACVGVVFVTFYFATPIRLRKNLSWEHRGSLSRRLHKNVYCDEDGEAPVASEGTRDRKSRILIAILAIGALLISSLNWLLLEFDKRYGIITAGWFVVNLIVLFLVREPSQKRGFTLGLLIALSSLALSLALVFAIYNQEDFQDPRPKFPHQTTGWSQLILGLCLPWPSASLSRRPPVYFEGRVVDGQLTSSVIHRYTFAWVKPLLDQARKLRRIEYDDLPALDHSTRSRVLQTRFMSNETSSGVRQSLWRAILLNHYGAISRQWIVAMFESLVAILPPVCLYNILLLFEKKSSAPPSGEFSIGFWMMCLAGTKLIHVSLDSWLQWISFAILATPVRSQLSAVIFAKSLRMKLLEGEPGHEQNATEVPDNSNTGEGDAHETDMLLPPKKADEKQTADTDSGKRPDDGVANGIVSLLGVDVQRVSDFCGYNVDLIRGIVKTAVAAGFLATLIGWWSTLAGFAVPLILQPFNQFAMRHYTDTQLQTMAARDNKAHVVTEALQGIRQIKFSATETQWEKRILVAREREIQAQKRAYFWGTVLTVLWIIMPSLIGAAALSVYAWLSQHMIASVAFTALSVFSSLETTIGAFSATITEMLDARVSANRIQQHLESEEQARTVDSGETVEFKDVSITWPTRSLSYNNFTLHDLNLRFPPKQLSVIYGKTGVGKSLLLAAIIGEAHVVTGEILNPRAPPMNMWNSDSVSMEDWIIPTALAYVGQVPWIANASVKETILFGLPYRHDRYSRVLDACALREDIKILPDGEDTEVGATGINLSGGQRWRLTFARALYSRAGVLVLDDIFSAVDSHVGRHLLDHGILGPLGANRTKVLVTHHIGLVEHHSAYLVCLKDDGTTSITEKKVDELCNTSPFLSNDHPEPSGSTGSRNLTDDGADTLNIPKVKARKFVEDETREYGKVKWAVYKTYLLASGGQMYWVMIFAVFSLAAVSTVGRSYWLALWTKTYTVDNTFRSKVRHASDTSPERHLIFYLSIYLAITTASIVVVGIKITSIVVAALRASRKLFEAVTTKVLRAQLRWLDTEPTGRILNRFVGDFAMIDSRIGGNVVWCTNSLFSIAAIIAAAMFISVWMLIPICVLSLLCFCVVYLYLDAARDVKRLESNAKSPLFELVGSALSGLATIRSFGRAEDYLVRMFEHIDRYSQASWYVLLATQWMRIRQGFVGVLFTLCTAAGVAYFPNIDASLAGFALSFALGFSDTAEDTISRYTSMELAMNSTERVLEYVHLKTESIVGADLARTWPSEGKIVVHDLEVGYAEDLPSVLHGVSFSVQPRDRIGIVGRTGSGKSSLTLALFRFLEARRGLIEIDGLDISTLKLYDLRSRLTIIPQDPVLFSGTLRANLDPFDEYHDSTLLEALERVNLIKVRPQEHLLDPASATTQRSNISKGLSSPITQGGSNLSQGEKQLVCLARAIITRPKILVLDEATSAVDMETDALIQRSIREEFRNSTLLVVAHRLSTVADFDKILVMKDGRVAEYDKPESLVRKRGTFWKMLNDSGEKEALRHLLQ